MMVGFWIKIDFWIMVDIWIWLIFNLRLPFGIMIDFWLSGLFTNYVSKKWGGPGPPSGSPCTYHLDIAPMSALLIKLFRSVPMLGWYLKCPDMAKLLVWEQYIVAVSGDVRRHCPRQFLERGAQCQDHGQAQGDIQVQPVQYICKCKSTPMPIQSISHNVTRISQDRKWLPWLHLIRCQGFPLHLLSGHCTYIGTFPKMHLSCSYIREIS